MGMAFYGRSFTLADPNCYQPNGVCEFSSGGRPGTCSSTSGILYYSEISSRNNSLDVHTYYNSTSTVKYNVYEGDQWVSYDDEESWHDKMGFLSFRCLSGLMIWSLDEDTGEADALNALMGDISSLEMEKG
jgi:chitinase